jgi:hypothetical protein
MKTITLNGVEYVNKAESGKLVLPVPIETAPYKIGEKYFIRTVTNYYTGKLVWVGDKEIVLDTASWIADTGRFMQAVKTGEVKEVEPMGDGVVIGRGAIIDAIVITWELPIKQK